MTQTTTKTRREIVEAIQTKFHAAYMVDTHLGAQSDMLTCKACKVQIAEKCGDTVRREDITPLTYSDLCAIFHEEGAVTFPACDWCKKDLGA